MPGFIKPSDTIAENEMPPMSSGWHIVFCTDVQDVRPSDKYANAKPRICFVFQEYDPRENKLAQNKAIYLCSASVFLGNAKIPESGLVKLARQVGYKNYAQGINPMAWKGRFYSAFVRHDGKTSYVDLLSPVGEPDGETPEDREAWVSLAIQSSPHSDKVPVDYTPADSDCPF